MRTRPAVELGDLARRSASSRWRSCETITTLPEKSASSAPSRSRRAMSRWASGSSSSSTSGRRARQAASATSLRWPPDSSRVGTSSAPSMPSARRWPSASPSARSPPAAVQRSSARSWRASARVSASRSAASAGSASRASAACSSASSAPSSGRAARTVAAASRASPTTICGRWARTSPRRAVTVAGVGGLQPGDDPQQRGLAAAIGAEYADAGARGHVEVGAAQDRAAAEGLRQAARRELGDGCGHRVR